MHLSPIETRLQALIEPSAKAMGFSLVQVHLTDGKRKTLRVLVEPAKGGGMGVDDCANLSYQISAVLDVEDVINGAYDLEVSSPGMDRPLTSPDDFLRFAGRQVKIEMQYAVEGRKRFKGIVSKVENGAVMLKTDEGEIELPFDSMRAAKLAPTDADFKAAMKVRTKAEAQ